MVSARGGVEIEQVADEDPDAIARLHINPLDGLLRGAPAGSSQAAGIDEARDGPMADVLVQAVPLLRRG